MPQASDRVLKLEYRGAPQTVSVLRDAVLASQNQVVVRRLAEEICGGLDSKDYLSEYLAIYHYLLRRARYMRDPRTVELIRSPTIVAQELLDGKTPSLDCDDFSAIAGALVLSVGGTAEMVTVAFSAQFYQGQQQYSHVFCRAQDPKTAQYVVLDPVAAEKSGEMVRRVVAAKIWPLS